MCSYTSDQYTGNSELDIDCFTYMGDRIHNPDLMLPFADDIFIFPFVHRLLDGELLPSTDVPLMGDSPEAAAAKLTNAKDDWR